MSDVVLHLGDCLDVLSGMEDNSVDTTITDPPYGLEFMGKDWDHGVPGVPFWREALRVAKPGAMMLAFGGTRTHHRLMCAIEDAGWEIRDCLMWLYGSGFPKSLDVGKAIDKAAGAEREVVGPRVTGDGHIQNRRAGKNDFGTFVIAQDGVDLDTVPATEAAQLWDGWGTALKPAWEPIILAMKPRDGTFAHNALTWGVAGLWVDGGRVPTNGADREQHLAEWNRAQSQSAKEGRNSMRGGLDTIDLRLYAKEGRWPANLILDEEAAALLDAQSGERPSRPAKDALSGRGSGNGHLPSNGWGMKSVAMSGYVDTGGASRFFYCAKASRRERNAGLEGMPLGDPPGSKRSNPAPGRERALGKPRQNFHPTVKPLALMRYLVRLTRTPTGGIVLDPFMGSGSTIVAAIQEGRDYIGIEKDIESFEIAEQRIAWAQEQARQEVQLELI